MERELKIVLSAFLVFLIFGLSTLLNSGSFVTPYFLDKIILLVISLLFIALNSKKEGSWRIYLLPIPIIGMMLGDAFYLYTLADYFENESISALYGSGLTMIVSLLMTFGYFIFVIIDLFLRTGVTGWLLLFIFLTLASFFSLGTEYFFLPHISMSLFFVLHFVFVQRNSSLLLPVHEVQATFFFGIFLLTTFQYFT